MRTKGGQGGYLGKRQLEPKGKSKGGGESGEAWNVGTTMKSDGL